ncbi:unnamed protein product [Anisakis simplex]|uniref:BRCT domain-containing protein n=1 Tax=Anisakis simplex TaxID=6269 RepID=A0A0M3JWB4_ANISI|nr:unnamed protein product [Anisakis simplex]
MPASTYIIRAGRRVERTVYMPLAKRIQLSSGNTSKEDHSDEPEAYSNPAHEQMLAHLMRKSREVDSDSAHTSHQPSATTVLDAIEGELVFVVEQPLSGLPLVQSLFAEKHSAPLRSINQQALFASPLSRHYPLSDTCSNITINNVPSEFPTQVDDERVMEQGSIGKSNYTDEKGTFSDEYDDAEFTATVLNNLPTSYDEFESKELHLKLERNISSPLMTCQSPATDCGRLSSDSNSTIASPMHPILDSSNMQPDAEDLEVAMINESFEEQQKQTKLYENPNLKNLFYSRPNMTEDADRAVCGSHDRLPYVVNISGQERKRDKGITGTVDASKRYIPPTDHHFTPGSYIFCRMSEGDDSAHIHYALFELMSSLVLTPNSSEMISAIRRLSTSKNHQQTVTERRPFDPLFRNAETNDNEFEQPFANSLNNSDNGRFDVEELILDQSNLGRVARGSAFNSFNSLHHCSNDRAALKESRRDFMKINPKSAAIPIKQTVKVLNASSIDDKMDATEALAMNVVESLFSGSASLGQRSPCITRQVRILYCFHLEYDISKMGDSEKCAQEEEEVCAPSVQSVHDAYCSSLAGSSSAENKDGKQSTAPIDSWEDLDSEDFDFKVGGIKSAMEKVKLGKPKVDFFAAATPTAMPWNDKEMRNVLEIYSLPSRISLDDVKNELAKIDCADVTFKKVTDSSYLINFSSINAGHMSGWLHLHELADASLESQTQARKYADLLAPHKPRPKTTALVARRLVEGALGVRTNVSKQQRNAERQVLNDAKQQKKATAALWEDNP